MRYFALRAVRPVIYSSALRFNGYKVVPCFPNFNTLQGIFTNVSLDDYRFYLYIPWAVSTMMVIMNNAARDASKLGSPRRSGMYKLLLVDDEEDVREGVVREINWEAIGFEVVDKAENGKEALEMVERLQPDVVVTDIQMPFMNGLQLAEAIRERFPTIKLIILTGHDEFEYAQRAIKLHIDEYVLKPFSAQELVNALLKVKDRFKRRLRIGKMYSC